MKKTLLFAIDPTTEEIIVSESAKGSFQIQPVERIQRQSNALLYQAVTLLNNMAKAPDLDTTVFSSMDKVCQLMYAHHQSKA